MVKNLPAMQETWVQSLGWEDSPGGGHGNPLQYSWTSLVAPKVKNLPANAGDLASSSRLGRSHRESIVKLETKYFRGNLKKYQNWTSSKTGISDTELVYEFKDNHLRYISLSLRLSLFFKIFIYLAIPGLSHWTTRETARWISEHFHLMLNVLGKLTLLNTIPEDDSVT